MEIKKRNTAYKLWISQLLQGSYMASVNGSPSCLNVNNKQIIRLNIIANVTSVNNYDNYSTAIIDDGTAAIRLKAWQQDVNSINNLNPGDIVLVVGRIREYNNERYILPEIVKKLDNPNWLLVRKLELFKQSPPTGLQGQSGIEEEKIETITPVNLTVQTRNKVVNAIDSINSVDGVSIEEITRSSNISRKEIELAVHELVREGEIYENKPGKLKLMQ